MQNSTYHRRFFSPLKSIRVGSNFLRRNDNFLLITHHLGAYPSIWISWYLKQNEKQNRTRITISLPTPYFILVQPSNMKRYWWWCFFSRVNMLRSIRAIFERFIQWLQVGFLFWEQRKTNKNFGKYTCKKRHSTVELLLSAFQGTEQKYAYSKAALVPI